MRSHTDHARTRRVERIGVGAICLSMAALYGSSYNSAAAQSIASPPDFSGIYIGSRTILEPDTYPFTTQGRLAHESFDPLTQDPRQADDCAPESVPAVIWAGTVSNMMLTEHEGQIEIYYEHGGTTRWIQMDGAPTPADQPHTPLGYSVGHWDSSALVIETTHLNSGAMFNSDGYPYSRDARITERYWREEGQNLQMELIVYDSANYTEPVHFGREWIWSPDEEVLPWNCVSLGPKDGEPDIDALRELLNDL